VGDVDHGRFGHGFVELGDLDAGRDTQRGIEVGQRLVEQEDLGIAADGPADGDALALAARERLGQPVEIVLELQDRRRPRAPAGRSISSLLCPRNAQAEGHVVVDRHVRVERVGLEHHGDAALGRRHVVDHHAVDSSVPPVISSSPAIIRRSVDLPQPEGPTKTMNSPCRISRSTPWITSTAP
jgi:hypothetical protein